MCFTMITVTAGVCTFLSLDNVFKRGPVVKQLALYLNDCSSKPTEVDSTVFV